MWIVIALLKSWVVKIWTQLTPPLNLTPDQFFGPSVRFCWSLDQFFGPFKKDYTLTKFVFTPCPILVDPPTKFCLTPWPKTFHQPLWETMAMTNTFREHPQRAICRSQKLVTPANWGPLWKSMIFLTILTFTMNVTLQWRVTWDGSAFAILVMFQQSCYSILSHLSQA